MLPAAVHAKGKRGRERVAEREAPRSAWAWRKRGGGGGKIANGPESGRLEDGRTGRLEERRTASVMVDIALTPNLH